MDHQLRVIRSVGQIDQIAPQWRALMESSGYALNDPEWYANAARFTHSEVDELNILTLWRSGELVALAPLVLTRSSGAVRYEIIGSRILYEPAEILAHDAQAADRIAAEIAVLDRPVLLGRLPARSQFNDAFLSRARGAGWVLSPNSSGSPYVDLSADWEPYYENLPSRIRNILRRAHRALGKLGRVQFEFIRPAPAAVSSLLEEAFQVELQSWKGRAGSAVLQRQDLRNFFFNYASAAAARGELLVSFLRFDGSPIAMQVANVGRNAYWQLKIGYDDRQSKFLPGLQLLLETIRWSFEQELGSYEFLGSHAPWIKEWTSKVRDHKTTLFYPFNVRGVGALLRDSFERVRRKLPARLSSSTP